MFNQSITGIRSNLEAFNQAAAKIAQPQTADQTAKVQMDYRNATSTADKVPDKTSMIHRPTRVHDANAPKETANDPGTRSHASQAVDQSRETISMMVAQKGVEANLAVLKTAQSLSGQTVNILA